MNPLTEFVPEAVEIDWPERSLAERKNVVSLSGGRGNERVRELVQRLFFQAESPVRYVGFTAIDAATEIWPLCVDVATSLAENGDREVGLVDARVLPVPSCAEPDGDLAPRETEELKPHLRFVARHTWLGLGDPPSFADSSLARLRTAIVQFDQTIVCLDPFSWMTARMSAFCDGLVLVVTANKTRRLVAAQASMQLKTAHTRLLGVVLAERRFPVPEALYRNL